MPPYAPVGQCIYCRRSVYSEADQSRRLGDEHIIPRQLGGKLILPEASCQLHENMTSGFETKNTALYEPGRAHLGITGRKSRKTRSRLPAIVGDEPGMKALIPKSDHPGILMGFQFDFPGILLGRDPGGELSGRIQVAPAVPNLNERLRKSGALRFKLGNGVSAVDFRRMLAKIGHAFTAAELGLDGWSPLLLDAISGERLDYLPWLVGSAVGTEDEAAQDHEIKFVDFGPGLIVVRVRLFACRGLTSHYVVSGRTDGRRASSLYPLQISAVAVRKY